MSNQAHPSAQGAATGAPQAQDSQHVSFAKDSDESTAYQEHNPPAVLRRQQAARRENSHPPADSPAPSGLTSGGPTSAAPSRPRTPPVSGVGVPPPFAPQTGGAGSHPLTSAGSSGSLAFGNRSAATSVSSLGSAGVGGGGTVPEPQLPSTGSSVALASDRVNIADEVHILVAVTGSVATIKVPLIIHKLKQIYRKRAVIQLVVTRASMTFFDPSDLPRDVKVWQDKDEWRSRQAGPEIGTQMDNQLHIRLRRWADILLVAPCSANTLAKFTYGICDNLLTSIFRVWNPEVPILIAPAMNTHMYTNPVTKRHFSVLGEYFPFVDILKPVEKVLVCGDIGMGGMREWTEIVQLLVKRVGVLIEDDDDDESSSDEK